MSRKDLPSPNTSNWSQRVTEEVRVLMGKMGSVSDRALTIGNLPGLGGFIPGGIGGGTGGSGAYEPDLTPPPTPTGFSLSAAISHVFVEHDAPLYAMGHGHAKTILYGAKRAAGDPPPTFSNAVVLAEFTGIVWAYPSDPATTWHMWIFWESVDGVRSSIPAGGTNGLTATTGQDVSLLLDALTGQITESELFSALGARIALIDGSGPGSVNARVATEANTRSTVDGYLGAQQTVRVDVAGHVAGYGIAGSSPDGTGASATSSFGVRANTFFVAPPSLVQATAPTDNLYDGFVWVDTSVTPNITRYRSGGTWTIVPPMLPFVIQTTPTTINGVPVPAGVYMADAYIRNGTITNAKIGNLAVDDAKIANLSVSKILAGSMVVGQYITSANYISGVQGWAINAAGTAEFSNAVVRGGVYASYGAIGGILIGGGNVYSANYVYNSSGFALFQDGWIHASNVRLRGSIMGGSFDGYGWPASGGGYYLGAEGLLVGNPNVGNRYFQLDSFGNVYAPNFSIINGTAYFNGGGTFSGNLSAANGTFSGSLTADAVNAVNTINIAGQTVTTISTFTSPPTTYSPPDYRNVCTATVFVQPNASGALVVVEFLGASGLGSGATMPMRVTNTTTNPGTPLLQWAQAHDGSVEGSVYQYPANRTIIDPAPASGWNTYVLEASFSFQWTGRAKVSILNAHR
jgi:hypothetical protein